MDDKEFHFLMANNYFKWDESSRPSLGSFNQASWWMERYIDGPLRQTSCGRDYIDDTVTNITSATKGDYIFKASFVDKNATVHFYTSDAIDPARFHHVCR